MSTETPRSDASKRVHSRYHDQRTPHFPRETYCVDYDDAARLERGLTAAREQIAALTADRDSWAEQDSQHVGELVEAMKRVAELKAVLRQWRIDFGDSMCFDEDPEARRFRDDTDALLAPSPETKP